MDCLKCDDDDKNTKKSVEQLNNIRDVDNTSQNDRQTEICHTIQLIY